MLRFALVVCLLATPIFATSVLLADEPKNEHPLVPLLRQAENALHRIDNGVKDYTCVLVRRERVDGRLTGYSYASVKLRHSQASNVAVTVPFSVYMHFNSPTEVAGREIIFVDGRHGGKLIARRGGNRFKFMTVAVDPESDVAMQDNRYPITELGIRNLIIRLLEVGAEELQHTGEIDVKYFTGAKINNRACTVVQITHPVKRDYFRFHQARLFIDDQLELPIRFVSFDWPEEPGGKPTLLEEYTYLDLRINVGLQDHDFDHRNENYKFPKTFQP